MDGCRPLWYIDRVALTPDRAGRMERNRDGLQPDSQLQLSLNRTRIGNRVERTSPRQLQWPFPFRPFFRRRRDEHPAWRFLWPSAHPPRTPHPDRALQPQRDRPLSRADIPLSPPLRASSRWPALLHGDPRFPRVEDVPPRLHPPLASSRAVRSTAPKRCPS
jgi:hypothetical protein